MPRPAPPRRRAGRRWLTLEQARPISADAPPAPAPGAPQLILFVNVDGALPGLRAGDRVAYAVKDGAPAAMLIRDFDTRPASLLAALFAGTVTAAPGFAAAHRALTGGEG